MRAKAARRPVSLSANATTTSECSSMRPPPVRAASPSFPGRQGGALGIEGRRRAFAEQALQQRALGGLDRGGDAGLAAFDRGDGNAVPEDDAVPGDGGHPRPRREDADQVERIAGRDSEVFPLRLAAPHRAQRVDRFGERELLARKTRDEAPAADLAARLRATQDAEDLAPRRSERLPRRQLAQQNAVAAQELARPQLGDVLGRWLERFEQRPAPLAGAARLPATPRRALLPPRLPGDERAQRRERVGGHEPRR